jgi:uncharacterized protein (TIGR02246 family)
MNKIIKTLAIAILATVYFGLLSCSSPSETTQTQIRSEDEEAIRKILLERIESFNRHEPPSAASFTPDADFVNVYGLWRKGSAEIESRQKERMDTVLKEAKITLLDLRIRFVRPDVAIAHQLHETSGTLNANGEKMPPHQELSVRVFVKEQGKWLITAFHNTIVRSDNRF